MGFGFNNGHHIPLRFRGMMGGAGDIGQGAIPGLGFRNGGTTMRLKPLALALLLMGGLITAATA
ncbi:MAG: hypothetical protein ACK5WN_14380 [Alphaproteobacteria bacterium]